MKHTTSAGQDKDFIKALFDGIDVIKPLQDALGGSTTWVLEWVEDNFSPEEVFGAELLARWAKENGWTEPE